MLSRSQGKQIHCQDLLEMGLEEHKYFAAIKKCQQTNSASSICCLHFKKDTRELEKVERKGNRNNRSVAQLHCE